jgi:DNA polymerase-3 subunit gamma/tau
VAAAGEVDEGDDATDEIVEALCDRDAGRALMAVAQACSAGRDARRVAEDLLGHLRNAFLATMARSLVMLPDDAAVAVEEQGRRLGPAGITRAVDEIGAALAEMREALDPRVSLEVALVRLTRADADSSAGALLERIERLERAIADGVPAGAPTPAAASTATKAAPASKAAATPPVTVKATASAASAPTPTASGGPGAAEARAALATVQGPAHQARPAPAPTTEPPSMPPPTPPRAQRTAAPLTEPAPSAPAAPPTEPAAAAGGGPSRDDLVKAWGDTILTELPPRVKARFAAGRFVGVEGDVATFAVPNAAHRDQCEPLRPAVESAISAHFGRPVTVRLALETAESDPAAPSSGPAPDEDLSRAQLEQLQDATAAVTSPEERLREAFPGAEEVTP